VNSKERVKAALKRRPVDRVPVFMWFHPSTTRRLAGLLEIPAAEVGAAMGNDVRMTWVNNNYAMEGIVHEHQGESHVDEWGIQWVKEGEYNQIVQFPLAHADADTVRAYSFPTGDRDKLVAFMDSLTQYTSDFFIGVDVSPCVFEMYNRLRGMEAALLDLAAQSDLAFETMGRCADFAVTLSELSCDRYPIDWLWTGDDVAGQQALFMSPACWREMIKPHLDRVFDVGRRRSLPLAYHCCGALRPIIGDLVEMELDVLNPIQCNCPGMDPLELKKEFGKDLAFMGGVDTQDLLPNGTAGDVRRATARLLEGMTADGGGYILAASHTVPPETPDENLFAMYAEAGITKEEIFDRAATIRSRSKSTSSTKSTEKGNNHA